MMNWKLLSAAAVVLASMVAIVGANISDDFHHYRIEFCEKRPEVLEHGLCKYCCNSQWTFVEVDSPTECKCEDWTLAKFPTKDDISLGYRIMYDFTMNPANFFIKDLHEGKVKIPG